MAEATDPHNLWQELVPFIKRPEELSARYDPVKNSQYSLEKGDYIMSAHHLANSLDRSGWTEENRKLADQLESKLTEELANSYSHETGVYNLQQALDNLEALFSIQRFNREAVAIGNDLQNYQKSREKQYIARAKILKLDIESDIPLLLSDEERRLARKVYDKESKTWNIRLLSFHKKIVMPYDFKSLAEAAITYLRWLDPRDLRFPKEDFYFVLHEKVKTIADLIDQMGGIAGYGGIDLESRTYEGVFENSSRRGSPKNFYDELAEAATEADKVMGFVKSLSNTGPETLLDPKEISSMEDFKETVELLDEEDRAKVMSGKNLEKSLVNFFKSRAEQIVRERENARRGY